MPRESYVWDRKRGELVPKAEYYAGPRRSDGIQVIKDIEPYRSTIDGHMVQSRSYHRAHLRQNGCVEVGNEFRTNSGKARHTLGSPGADIRAAMDRGR